MTFSEQALAFSCQGECLYGILALPEQAAKRGVLVIVGGPQYRVGSHRQFTLLARHLAAQGIPAMRFDYRGMGDSEGRARTFEHIDEDIRAAIDQFFQAAPGLEEIVLWGLCDAASAAMSYAPQDKRVSGLVLLNPWVRTEQGLAKAFLKRYYLKRALDPNLWRKIGRGQFEIRKAAHSFLGLLASAKTKPATPNGGINADSSAVRPSSAPLPDRLHDSLRRYEGAILLILSGDDMTAQEFSELVATSRKWRKLLARRNVQRQQLKAANHTFSQQIWRDQVASWTSDWVRSR